MRDIRKTYFVSVEFILLLITVTVCNLHYDSSERKLLDINNNITLVNEIKHSIAIFIDNERKTNNRRDFFFQRSNELTLCEYKLLGASNSEIYLWLLKATYRKSEGKTDRTDVVSLPFVFKYRKDNKDAIQIYSFDFPNDGISYSRDLKKLFPDEIINLFPNYEVKVMLEKRLDTSASKSNKNTE